MADVTVKKLDEFKATFQGAFKLVRSGLGVKSFGMQVIEMPPNIDQYPEHDHSEDGMEEVYTVLEGKAVLRAGEEEHVLEPGIFARVGPGERRHIRTEDSPVRLLALGGIPGTVYEPNPSTEESAADAA
jgi:uncharacterized cupin superfamily protein